VHAYHSGDLPPKLRLLENDQSTREPRWIEPP